jgi:Holliday junction resolvase RusA-like endonuclease
MAVEQIKFTVYAKAEPQGSMKGFVSPGKNGMKARAILTSSNSKMKPYRGEVTRSAMVALRDLNGVEPMAGKHVPVSMVIDFYLERPQSIPKKRKFMVVKPDLDKLLRSSVDALTGILYVDDAQIVENSVRKHYGVPERVEISVTILSTEV